MTSASRNIVLLLDWDSTLTRNDTLAAIASIADSSASGTIDSTLPEWWQDLVKAYIIDFKAHTAAVARPTGKSVAVRELDSALTSTQESLGERAWLASLAGVERSSFERGKATSHFEHVDEAILVQQVANLLKNDQVQLRDGSIELLDQLDHISIAVVSVNWSRAFIRECLNQKVRETLNTAISEKVANMQIRANEIFSHFTSPDAVDGIYTSEDKLRTARALTATIAEPKAVIYVGDSITDLECLLEADVGVCIRDEPMSSGQRELASALNRIGVLVSPLSELNNLSAGMGSENGAKQLWWSASLLEISHLLR